MADIVDGIERTKGLIDNIFNDKNFNPKKVNFQKKGFEEAQKQKGNPSSLRSYFEQLESALLDHCTENNEELRIKREKAERKIVELENEKQLLPGQIENLELEKKHKETEYNDKIENIQNKYNLAKTNTNNTCNQQIDNAETKYDGQIDIQNNNYDQQIQQQNANYDHQVNTTTDNYNNQLDVATTQYNTQIENRKKEFDNKIRERQDYHNNQIDVTTAQYNMQLETKRKEFDNKVQVEQNNYDNEIMVRKTEYDSRIRAKQQQIIRKQEEQNNLIETDSNNSKNTIKDAVAKKHSKLELIIESILLIGTTLFLILFYSSAVNTALFKDFNLNEESTEQDIVIASIFDPNAIPNAIPKSKPKINTNMISNLDNSINSESNLVNLDSISNESESNGSWMNFIFLILAPIIFLTFGYVLHIFWDKKEWLKSSVILLIAFLFDCLIAFFVDKKIFDAFGEGDFSLSSNFLIVLGFGFVVYLFWGILYGTFINKWNTLNPNKNEYINLNKEIEEISKDIDALEKEQDSIIATINDRRSFSLNRLQETNVSEVNRITQERDTTLKNLQETKTNEINNLIVEKDIVLKNLQENKTNEINNLIAEKDTTLKRLQETNVSEVNRIKQERDTTLQNLQETKTNEINRIKQERDTTLQRLQDINIPEFNRLTSEKNTIIGGIVRDIETLQNRFDIEIDRKIQEQHDILIETDRHRVLSLDDRQYFNDFYNGWTNWITIGIESKGEQISLDHNCNRVLTNFLLSLKEKYNWESR